MCICNSGLGSESKVRAINKLSGGGQVIALKSAIAHTLSRFGKYMLHFRLILVAITFAVSTALSGQPHGETMKFPDFLRITPDQQKQTTIVLYNYRASLGLFEVHEFKPPHNTLFNDNTFYILRTLEEPPYAKKWEYFRTGPNSWNMVATDSLGTTFRQVQVIDEVIHSDTLDYCRAYGDGFELISQILVYSKTN